MKLHKKLNMNSIILFYVFRISVIIQRLHYISEAEKLQSRRLINGRQIINIYWTTTKQIHCTLIEEQTLNLSRAETYFQMNRNNIAWQHWRINLRRTPLFNCCFWGSSVPAKRCQTRKPAELWRWKRQTRGFDKAINWASASLAASFLPTVSPREVRRPSCSQLTITHTNPAQLHRRYVLSLLRLGYDARVALLFESPRSCLLVLVPLRWLMLAHC